MLDALMYAVRDNIRAAGMGYGKAECEIMDDGRPPPRCGKVFVSVCHGKERSTADNQLNEYYDFSVVLTMRVTISLDRVGDQLLHRNIERVPQGQREGFRARLDQLRAFLHMNWAMTVQMRQLVLSANDNLAKWNGNALTYGFCEPARYRGAEIAKLVGGEWFGAEPDAEDVGIKAEMRFEGARRMQPQTAPVGPFV